MKRRLLVSAAWLGSLLLAAGTGLWAAGETLVPPTSPLLPPQISSYRVIEGEIGQSITLLGFAEWPSTPVALNQAVGVVTFIPELRQAAVGDVFYRVDERPVVAGSGSIPAFRDLSYGLAGEDVRQLQTMLGALGVAELTADGRFGSETRLAVQSWQTSLGVEADGTVLKSDIIWLPRLPAEYVLGVGLKVGTQVSGGEEILIVDESPRVWVPVGVAQGSRIPEFALVRASFVAGDRQGRIRRAVPKLTSEAGDLDLILEGLDGGAICAEECDVDIPVGVRSEIRVEITLVPRAEGPVVPASAVATRPDGSAYVTTVDGREVSVSVLGSEGSVVLVTGIEVGDEILVFGREQ